MPADAASFCKEGTLIALFLVRGFASERGAIMNRLRNYLQHRLNPVHMYCRLMDFGLADASARRVCSVYERFIYKGLLFH